MSDPNEPRQPPRPPTFTPPSQHPEYPPTSQFPPVSPGPYPPQPPAYAPGVAQPPSPYQPPPEYEPTAGWAQPPYDSGTGYPQPGYGPPQEPTAYGPPQEPTAYGPSQEPTGYGPPQGTPGYGPPQGPPGYGPPGYGPPQRPKRSATPYIALVLAIALLLCGGVVAVGKILVDRTTEKAEEIAGPILDPTLPALPTDGPQLPGLPTDFPDLPGLPTDLPTDLPTGIPGVGTEISVTYEVTGDGPAEIVYIESGNSPKRVGNAKLPWKFTTKLSSPAAVYVVAIRAGLGDGGIKCRTTVDGEQVAEHSAEGTLATANCYKLVVE